MFPAPAQCSDSDLTLNSSTCHLQSDVLSTECSVVSATRHVVFPPFDILRGSCFFKHALLLDTCIAQCTVVHFAPNCATFSRAREYPIKGCLNPPKPLRSERFLKGLPNMLSRTRTSRRLKLDTLMAEGSATRCLQLHLQVKMFSLEHTGRSLAIHLPVWKRLMKQKGVHSFT